MRVTTTHTVAALVSLYALVLFGCKNKPVESAIHTPVHTVRMIAFGDINLGRTVGKKILHEGSGFPFKYFPVLSDSFDIVFANLESQLSFQNGETELPKHNLIFTGPPQGAKSLADAGFTIVSTANNHAFDYGMQALEETIDNLSSNNIFCVGTTKNSKYLYEPLCYEVNGIRFAFFAVTDIMNFRTRWHGHIARADTSKLFPKIREAKKSVDVVVLSYHGGIEYDEQPSSKIKNFAKQSVREGVDIFLGHHPHVPYGIEKYQHGYIVHSLGNLIFYQPKKQRTEISYGTQFVFQKDSSHTSMTMKKITPVRAGYQPRLLQDSTAIRTLLQRVQRLSNITIN